MFSTVCFNQHLIGFSLKEVRRIYCIKTTRKKKKKSSLFVMARRPIDSPEDRNKVPYRLQCIR